MNTYHKTGVHTLFIRYTSGVHTLVTQVFIRCSYGVHTCSYGVHTCSYVFIHCITLPPSVRTYRLPSATLYHFYRRRGGRRGGRRKRRRRGGEGSNTGSDESSCAVQGQPRCACGSAGIGAGVCARVGAGGDAGVRDGSHLSFTEQGCEAAAAGVTSAAAAGFEVRAPRV